MLTQYNKLVEEGKLKPDEAQKQVAERLELLSEELIDYVKPKGLVSSLIGKKGKKPKGLFIHGKVGRGKSTLMDTFFRSIDIPGKKRVHFHEYMLLIHSRLHAYRSNGASDDDVVTKVGKEFAKGLNLLCFDEYEVNDVTNAMILSKLFKAMEEAGVVFVFTSNKPPEEHYMEGLQRQSYVEFCKYLEKVVDIISLEAKRDYRMIQEYCTADNFIVPDSYESTQKIKEIFKFKSAEPLHPVTLHVQGREIKIRAAGRIAWASFQELCGKPLGTADYLEIAWNYDVLFLESIPKMNDDMSNEVRRFINLIDILYENKVLLIATADAEPDKLYLEGATASFEFHRTASRLIEMRRWTRKKHVEERFD